MRRYVRDVDTTEYHEQISRATRRKRNGKRGAGPFYSTDRRYKSNAQFNGALLRG